MLDPKTLSFAAGLANLLFALLATLYIANSRSGNPALEIWRWGRLVAGCAFLLNLASSTLPIPPILGNLVHTVSGILNIAAYCLLLERRNWRTPLAMLGVGSIALLLLIQLPGGSKSLHLLVFSGLAALFHLVLATLLLRASQQNWLTRLIGYVDLGLVVVLMLRVGKGLAVGPLVRFDTDLITLLLYLTVFVVAMINGFGFLLLVKQKDDRALYRALDELEQAEQTRLEFMTQAAHEFRTPAALIKASLDSLRFVQQELPPAVTRRLDNIRLATQRLNDLSNTLLTHDRLNNHSMLFQPQAVDLVEQLREALKLYPAEARLIAELPAEALPTEADPAQLRIAVQNLIDNALEHNPPDSGPVRVFVQIASDWVDICVADCGSGIADHDKPEIFKRFYNPGGHFTRGVGLSIVHKIARNHGGDALVRDNSPRGTVMVLRLPRAG